MNFDTELVPIAILAKRLNFKTVQALGMTLAADPAAPRIIRVSRMKHFVRRDELDRWLNAKYAEAA